MAERHESLIEEAAKSIYKDELHGNLLRSTAETLYHGEGRDRFVNEVKSIFKEHLQHTVSEIQKVIDDVDSEGFDIGSPEDYTVAQADAIKRFVVVLKQALEEGIESLTKKGENDD